MVDRVALVTGGAAGFGQAICVRLAEAGIAVAAVDLKPAEETAKLVERAGGRLLQIQADITSPDDVARAVRTTAATLGPIDILIANAGIYPIASFQETSWVTWRRVMDVNVDSMYHLFQAVLPSMVERRWGRLVAITSGAFYNPPPNFSAYIASKGATIGLVRGISQEVGTFGVTVNSIAPTLVDTPGVAAGPQRSAGLFEHVIATQAIKREGRPEDITGMIAFLCSDQASFITGQTIAVDGGVAHL